MGWIQSSKCEFFIMSEELSKEELKELEKLKKQIVDEAKKVVDNYVDNPSEISGSVVSIHENSPFLDSNKDGEPIFSGSRWTKVIR